MRQPNLGDWWQLLLGIVLTAFAGFQIITGYFAFPNFIQRSIHVGFGLVICFLLFSIRGAPRTKFPPLWDVCLVILSAICTGYIVLKYDYIIWHGTGLNKFQLALGVITFILVLEAGRRTLGIVFPALAGVAFVYAIAGPLIPGHFAHSGIELRTIFEYLYFGPEGIWGFFTGISATTIALYILLAPVLLQTGGARAFRDIALSIAGSAVGGAAKVSCISSALFGTISGSCVANVATTGAFTIPMMKRLGYSPPLAAAVEAVASTGGQIMPPIMGAGAFIMSELLGIPYIKIIAFAAIPALLYFSAALMGIHFEAKRVNLLPIPPDQIPRVRGLLKWSLLSPIVFPVFILFFLLFKGYSPDFSALGSLLTSIALYFLLGGSFTPKQLLMRGRQIIEALQTGAKALAGIAVLIACAQIIVMLINLTGFGVKFSSLIIAYGAEHMILTLVLAMIVSMILGMGIPTTGAYLIAVTIVGVVLIKLGVLPIAAHMFVFYFAILSAVTPPVCTAVFVAAAMAESNWLKVGWISVRLALPTFVVGFIFVLNPVLLLQGKLIQIVIASATALIGVICMSAGTMGYLARRANWIERCVLIAASVILIVPGIYTDIIGISLLATTYIYQRPTLISACKTALSR